MASDRPQRAGNMKNTASCLGWGFHSSSAIIQAVFVTVAVDLEKKKININAITNRTDSGRYFQILSPTRAQDNLKIFPVHGDLHWLSWYHMKYKTMKSFCRLQIIILGSDRSGEILGTDTAVGPKDKNCHWVGEGAAERLAVIMWGVWEGGGSHSSALLT